MFILVKTYTIVEVSKLLGISQSSLRKYEQDYNLHIKRNELQNREYTDEDIRLLQMICEMKNQGHNIHTIRQALNNNPEALEYKEKSLESSTIYDLNGVELMQLMKKAYQESIQEIQEQHKKEIEGIRDEIRAEFSNQARQRESENEKLIQYIHKSREEEKPKGLLNRIFGK